MGFKEYIKESEKIPFEKLSKFLNECSEEELEEYKKALITEDFSLFNKVLEKYL